MLPVWPDYLPLVVAARLDPRRLLGIVTFGSDPPLAGLVPAARVEMEPLVEPPLAEVWRSDQECAVGSHGGIDFARNEEVVFGVLRRAGAASLEAETEEAYDAILSFIGASDYPHLLRMWNHFPAINVEEAGLERYRSFCLGRFEGFLGSGYRLEGDLPAASGVGSNSGDLVVYFIASRSEGCHVENPRQVSAFRYPERYGPRSPSFARGTLKRWEDESQLYISGTASIVGHESVHEGDLAEQLEETMTNMAAVLAEATGGTERSFERLPGTSLKAYVRYARDGEFVATALRRHLHPDARLLVVRGDVCRSELLIEVEGVIRMSPGTVRHATRS